ncbi:MAG: curli production assembly protein CsgG [Acidobacteria bacterium]|nr:curli production assembly protein CsgG [Acidobacteriota bacterium]
MRKGFCFVATLALFVLPAGAQAPKKRVAILNFDYATVSSSVAAIFGTNMDVGKGVADLLVGQLVEGGVFSVYERKSLDKIMAEQNLSNSDRADPQTASKIGRVLGVDAIVMGSITQFGRDDRTTNVGGGVVGGITRRYGLGGVGKRESKAVVGISARLVDASTAEILATANSVGESSRGGATLLGSGGSRVASAGGVMDMSSKNFGATLLGEAVNKAVTGLARQVESNAARLPTHKVVVEGLVADASGAMLVINVGTRAGVKVGDQLEVSHPVREIRDPASGKVIRRIEEKLGVLVITEADEQSAVGKFSGAGTPKVGDAVKTAQ